jgi:hypothetical protein
VKAAGLEPDDCFYLANYQAVIGKDRIDLSVDPPPDLAIESDYTSKTKVDAYMVSQVITQAKQNGSSQALRVFEAELDRT